jgi:hypothetical protein
VNNITFKDLYSDESSLYTLLYHSGYLRGVGDVRDGDPAVLALVNYEVERSFSRIFSDAAKGYFADFSNVQTFLDGLLNSDAERMKSSLDECIGNIASQNYELTYGGLLGGLFNCLNKDRYVLETESRYGGGISDFIIKTKFDKSEAFVVELKVGKKPLVEKTEQAGIATKAAKGHHPDEGIAQIRQKGYDRKLLDEGYPKDKIKLVEIIIDSNEVKHIGIVKA